MTPTAAPPLPLAQPAPPGPAFAVKATLLLGSMMTVMAGAVVAAALPQIEGHFAGTPQIDLLAKLVLTAPALAIAITAPLSGWFADAVGRKTLFLGGLFFYVGAGTTGLYVEDLWVLLAGRVGLGIGVGMVMTASTTLVSDYFAGPARAKFMGTQAAFMSLAGVIFIPLGGALAKFGWHAPFAVYFAALPIVAMVILSVREPDHKKLNAPLPGDAGHVPWPTVAVIYAVGFAGMLAFYLGPTQVPFLMKHRYAANELGAVLPLAGMTVMSAVVSSRYGTLAKLTSPRLLLAAMFLMVGAGFAAVGLTRDERWTWLGLLTCGLGSGLLIPTLSTWLMRAAPPAARGRLSGGLIASIFAGQFASPIVFRAVSSGLDDGFATIGLAMLVPGAVFLAASRRQLL